MANGIQKDLGKVTAYSYAKAAGYTGTEEQFQAIFNEFTKNAPGLIDRMDTAVERAEAAVTNIDATVQDAVDDAVEEATASAVATANQAVSDAQAAQTAAEGAVTQANNAVTQANAAVTAAQAAQSAAEDAAESFVLDRTLTDSGAAAPADLVGNLKESTNELKTAINDIYTPEHIGFTPIYDNNHTWVTGAFSNGAIITNRNAVTILSVPLINGNIIGMENFGSYEFTLYDSTNQLVQYYTSSPFTITADGTYSIMVVKNPREEIVDKVGEIASTFGILNANVPASINDSIVSMNALTPDAKSFISPLFGKKIVFLGDSITAGYELPNYVTWCNKVGEKYSMDYYNYGINSNPIAKTTADTSGLQPMVIRYADMVDGADYVVVEGGANDRAFSVTLGTDDSTDITTFKGALNVLIDGLYTKYPKAKIVFLTPWYRIGNSTPNGANLYEKDYVGAMLQICANHSVPCFDNYHDSGMSWQNTAQVQWMDAGMVKNGTINYHFSAEAYTWMMPIYEALLSRL